MRALRRLTAVSASLAVGLLAGCGGVLSPGSQGADARGDAGQVEWTHDTGADIWGSPVSDGSTVYVGNDDGVVTALDLTTGAVRWTERLDGAVRVRPALHDGQLYLSADDGSLYALRATNGSRVWSVDIGSTSPERAAYDTGASSPVVVDGVVHVGSSDGTVVAADAGTGEILWTAQTGGPVRSTPAVTDEHVYVGSDDGSLYALERSTGDVVWSAGLGGAVTSTPTVHDGAVVVGSRGAKLVSYDTADGSFNWARSYSGSWVQSSATVSGSSLFIGSSDLGRVLALDPATGESRWETEVDGWPWGVPTVEDGTVYIGSMYMNHEGAGSSFYALDASSGDIRWTASTEKAPSLTAGGVEGMGVVSIPIVVDGLVVFGAIDGKVYALRS